MKARNYIFLLLLSVIFANGCREDSILVTEEETEIPQLEDVTYQFLITNEIGDPINDAQILINTEVYTTDENGVAITQPQKVSSLGQKIKVSALEHEPIVKVVDGVEGAKIMEKIVMFGARSTIISAGSTGTIDDGGKLTLPLNLMSSDGSVYSGDVTVRSKYLDPDDKEFLRSAPGNLLALNTSDEYQLLASLGMYMIELYDDNGEVLEIQEGTSATIEFPIADKHKNNISGEIPLWYFDEDKGVWIEDGVAKVEGDVMIAEVNHFTWWNCDLPFDFTLSCLTLLDIDGDQMAGLEVGFSIDGTSFGLTTTDVNGNVAVKVPLGVIFELTYFIEGYEIGTQNIGPFAENARKEVINTGLSRVRISGNAIDCDGNIVANGYGHYTTDNGTYSVLFAADGSFSYYGSRIDHELILIDISTYKSAEIDISEAEQETDLKLGTIEVCEEEIITKVSGHILIDTNKDLIGDTPLPFGQISVYYVDDQTYEEFVADENGYYEFDVLPESLHSLAFFDHNSYTPIGMGDNSPDGDPVGEGFEMGRFSFKAMSLLGENDSDNDFLVIPAGEGIVSGTFMGDTNNDGIGDIPLEWARLDVKWVHKENHILVNQDGTFSTVSPAGSIKITAINGFAYFNITSSIDLTPDPEDHEGSNTSIPVILYDGEVDADNTFVIERTTEKSALFMVMEDTDMDGIGDVPVSGVSVFIHDRNTGEEIDGYFTNSTGIKRFLTLDSDVVEITATIESSEYEVINVIDTSPDNDPFIVDGDVTKMEIDLADGEWDSGNIFVVRKI